ncbi:hypothetical protein ACQP1O_18995 [Nocardia sp. CA-151230]|uniref:hypothetical protein n=1 Tax=Nocardia sp. CA-151230 TaxID=3239982 RepID=UPI003D8D63BD
MHDDPELAQARNFLGDLRQHALTLTRRRESIPSAAAPEIQSFDAELAVVRSQIDKLLRRFPALQAGSPILAD